MGFFSNLRLHNKIFLFLFGIMTLLLGGSLMLVRLQSQKTLETTVRRELEQSAAYLTASYASSVRDLEFRLNTLISAAPYLRALLTDTRDPDTILQWAKSQGFEGVGVPYFLVTDAEGTVYARTHAPRRSGDTLSADSPLRHVLDGGAPSARFIADEDGRYYDVVAVPVMVGGYPVGLLAGGREIGSEAAYRLREETDCEIVFVHGNSPVASSLPASDLARLKDSIGEAGRLMREAVNAPRSVRIGGAEFMALAGDLSAPGMDGGVHFVLLRSVDKALAPYVRIQRALLAVGLAALAIALGASLYVARGITRPIAMLVSGANAVQKGDYHVELRISSRDEVGALAAAFNEMVRGLREKLEMQKFVSESTRDMIRRGPAERKTERKRVTMLFSDIRGFSSISENLPPEQVIYFVNHALAEQSTLVKKYGGDIDKFVGDELIAVFEGEDMVLRAIRCAIEIQKTNLGDTAVEGQTKLVRVGIGINTGEIVFGSIGNVERQDYTILGSPVNLCARLCAAAREGEILIAEGAFREVAELVAAEKMEPIRVKGFEKPVPIYGIRVGA